MPVPSTIADLSTTPGSNSPAGSESPNLFDDYMRAAFAFIKTLDNTKLAAIPDGSISTTKIVDDAVTLAKLQNIATGRFLGRTTAGSGDVEELTGPNLFAAIKQAATETVTGVVELATAAEARAGTDADRAITPATLAASVLGFGQTEQDVSGARTSGVWYYNTTGRPIVVYVQTLTTAFVSAAAFLGAPGSNVSWSTNALTNLPAVFSFIVRPGVGYRVDCSNGFAKWIETR